MLDDPQLIACAAATGRWNKPVPGKRKVPKCQARQVQHLAQTHFEAQDATSWSWSTRPAADAQKRQQAAEPEVFYRSEQRLNVNFIKRNYKLVCQSVGLSRLRLRLGPGTGRWEMGAGSTSETPRAKFQAHTSLNEQETEEGAWRGRRRAGSNSSPGLSGSPGFQPLQLLTKSIKVIIKTKDPSQRGLYELNTRKLSPYFSNN